MHFQVDTTVFLKSLQGYEETVGISLRQRAAEAAKELEGVAKQNAPWNDQSGQARASIKGEAIVEDKGCRIIVSGNTPYFPYLEMAREGRFAILWPTVLEGARDVLYQLSQI